MKLIAEGASAGVYVDDNHRLIKLFKDSFPKERIQKEARNQKTLYEMGLPVPKVFEITALNGRYALVMEYIRGTTLGEKIIKNTGYVNGITIEQNLSEETDSIHTIIDLQIKVHSVTLQEFPLMKEKLTEQINRVNDLNEKQKGIILKKLDPMRFRNNVCHGDFHPFNVIETDKGGIIILDWADAAIGNPEADIYRTYMIIELHQPETAEKYLEIYCNKTGADKEEILHYEPILMTARLSETITKKERAEILHRLKKYV
ncbi:MAG: aminoglycoside phosphotransferase family protein [Treponema sp.]|jgi:aminoglycoside phosphotransferase (APT) family kinase protein|nr:aminoglycoside phosphotransferase family protein [Treponema sp.]